MSRYRKEIQGPRRFTVIYNDAASSVVTPATAVARATLAISVTAVTTVRAATSVTAAAFFDILACRVPSSHSEILCSERISRRRRQLRLAAKTAVSHV